MSYLRGFIPWIAFAALSTVGWQWGALAGLVIGVRLLMQDRKAGVATDALILQFSTVVYFAALTAFAFAAPHSPVEHYDGAVSFAWLALTAWGTLAATRPFTLGIAKQQAPKEVWGSPAFLRINVVLTAAWATAFTLTAAAVAACDAAHLGSLATTGCQVAGFVVPAVFTARYPKAVQARLAATATPVTAAR
ncbi:hypothetical protein ACEZCY_09920 [Streptacidiphilus sp. N1-12]|uniref:Uncharacterized protein n=2 Tax=Streptacidiphilus alkalitolerans TaxID=3342712 RepID=A0ABV6WBY3_9ACTN